MAAPPPHPTLTKDALDIATRMGTIVKRYHDFNDFAPNLATHPDNFLMFKVDEQFHKELAGRVKQRLEVDFKFGEIVVVDTEKAKPPALDDAFTLALRSGTRALIYTQLHKYLVGTATGPMKKEAEQKLSDFHKAAAGIRDSRSLIVMGLADGELPKAITDVPVFAWDTGIKK